MCLWGGVGWCVCLCIPLFVAQVSSMLAIRLDMEVDSPVNTPGETGKLLMSLKMLMVLILQLMNFGYLLSTMRLLVFVSNPLTWIDVIHPHSDDWIGSYHKGTRWLVFLFKPWFIMPWPFLALHMRLCIGYMVCVDSVSIILVCDTATDVIFNALAVGFILDLNGFYLQFCATVFRLENTASYKIEPGAWEKRVRPFRLTEKHAKTITFPGLIECMANTLPWLRRGFGARRLETAITFVGMCLIYTQQLFVVMHALDTDVLPLARDVCTWWRWEHGHSGNSEKLGFYFATVLDSSFSFIDVRHLTGVVVNSRLDQQCMHGQKYDRMRTQDRLDLTWKFPGIIMGGMLVIISILVLPQLPHEGLISFLAPYDENREEKEAIEDLESVVKRQHQEIKELMARTKSLEDEVKLIRKRDRYFA